MGKIQISVRGWQMIYGYTNKNRGANPSPLNKGEGQMRANDTNNTNRV